MTDGGRGGSATGDDAVAWVSVEVVGRGGGTSDSVGEDRISVLGRGDEVADATLLEKGDTDHTSTAGEADLRLKKDKIPPFPFFLLSVIGAATSASFSSILHPCGRTAASRLSSGRDLMATSHSVEPLVAKKSAKGLACVMGVCRLNLMFSTTRFEARVLVNVSIVGKRGCF